MKSILDQRKRSCSDDEPGCSLQPREPIFWVNEYQCSVCGIELPPSFIEERREHFDFHLAERLQDEESSNINRLLKPKLRWFIYIQLLSLVWSFIDTLELSLEPLDACLLPWNVILVPGSSERMRRVTVDRKRSRNDLLHKVSTSLSMCSLQKPTRTSDIVHYHHFFTSFIRCIFSHSMKTHHHKINFIA